MPERDPVTDPPPVVVVPLWVDGGLSAGAVSPPSPDDVLNVSDGLTAGDDDRLGEVVVWAGFFVPVAETLGLTLGEVAGAALVQ